MVKSSKYLPFVALILVVALIGLLMTLGALQYKWLGELNESKLELTRSALRAGALRLSEDFDHELASIFVSFQVNFSILDRGAEEYAKVYDRWVMATPYPKLIRALYLVRAGEDEESRPLRFDRDNRRLDSSDWPEGFETLREKIAKQSWSIPFGENPAEITPPAWLLRMFDGEIPALIIPMYPRPMYPRLAPAKGISVRSPREALERKTFGWTIAVLDLNYIKQEVIPALANRYFSTSDHDGGLDYDLLIVSRSHPARTIYSSTSESPVNKISDAEVKVDLFRLRLTILIRIFSERFAAMSSDTQSGMWWGRNPAGSIRKKPEMSLFRRSGFGSRFLRQFLDNQEGQWQLALIRRVKAPQHVIADVRRRNLVIGFGVLALLSASIIMIFILLRRMHLLARQQMEFVAGVSHELRTPVAVLCSASENLADGMIRDREDILQYAEMIRSESYQLAELVEQVLEFAGTQSLRNPYQLSPISVTEVIESALALYASHFVSRGFSVEKLIEPGLPPITADRAALGRALQNLLDNAMKFSSDQRLIAVSARAGGGKSRPEVMISVENQGIGIEPDELKHIFEPFRRGRAAVSSQIRGNGLGLSIVKHIVEGHYGRVTVRSSPHQGNTFTIHLPASSEHAAEQAGTGNSEESL
jgi:two-component system, OmpR family, sensor histidine kinase SenX3